MIRLNSPTRHRYTAVMVTATLALLTGGGPRASAQMLGNIFSGTNDPGATAVSTANSLVAVGTNQTATIGPGFSTTVGLTLGVADTLTASLNAATAPGELILSETSAVGFGVADAGGHFSVDKTFTGTDLNADSRYQFTLTRSQASLLSVLTDTTVRFALGGVTLNTFDLLALFTASGGNTATVTFNTPATLNPAGPLEITLAGDTTAGLIGNNITFTSATFNQVPEPGTWAFTGAGLGVLWGVQRFRRARRA